MALVTFAPAGATTPSAEFLFLQENMWDSLQSNLYNGYTWDGIKNDCFTLCQIKGFVFFNPNMDIFLISAWKHVVGTH